MSPAMMQMDYLQQGVAWFVQHVVRPVQTKRQLLVCSTLSQGQCFPVYSQQVGLIIAHQSLSAGVPSTTVLLWTTDVFYDSQHTAFDTTCSTLGCASVRHMQSFLILSACQGYPRLHHSYAKDDMRAGSKQW